MKNTHSHVYSVNVCKTGKRIRVEEEFTLPDYCSDVSRIITVEGFPTLYSKKSYIRDGVIFCDVSGAMQFNVVYLSDTPEVEAYSFSTDFSDTVKTDFADIDEESAFVFVVPSVESSICKVQSPRRINVRAELGIAVDVRANRSFDYYVKGQDPAETRECRVTALRCVSSRDGDFKVSEEIKLPKSCPPMERILCANLNIGTETAGTGDNSVNFVGSADISCIYVPEEEGEKKIYSFYQPLELRGSLEVDEARGDMSAVVKLVPSSFSYEISSDELGENRVLKVDISYTAQCLAEENSAVTVTEDIYGVGCKLTPEYSSGEFRRYVGTLREENAVKEKIPLKKGIKELEGIIAAATVRNTYFENGELYADCKINLQATGITDDVPCSVNESVDVAIHLNLPAEVSGYRDELSFDISSLTGYVDASVGDGEVGLAFDVTVIAHVYHNTDKVFVSSVNIGEKTVTDGGRVFCYPSEDDTAWTVGKRYGVAISALAEANSMTSAEPLKRVMVIPVE